MPIKTDAGRNELREVTIEIKQVISNSVKAKNAFLAVAREEVGGGRAVCDLVITRDDLAALKQGKCIAVDDSEYSTFIMLAQDALGNSE